MMEGREGVGLAFLGPGLKESQEKDRTRKGKKVHPGRSRFYRQTTVENTKKGKKGKKAVGHSIKKH